MKTQCTGEQLEFHALGRRSVIGRFDGGRISSDAGRVEIKRIRVRQLGDVFGHLGVPDPRGGGHEEAMRLAHASGALRTERSAPPSPRP